MQPELRDGAIGQGFLRKVYRTSLAGLLVALLVSLRWASWQVSAGVAAGWGLSVGILAFWQLVVRLAFGGDAPRPGVAGLALLLKLPVAAAVVWLLISRVQVDPIAFAVGFLIPQTAIGLLVVVRKGSRAPRPAAGEVGQRA